MKTFAVIGLGRFGTSLAITLCRMGHEVLAIDEDEKKVEEIIEFVTHAVQADAKDEQALKELDIKNFDAVIVSVGKNIQASIWVTVILKEMGVKKIIAKAQTELHGKVLSRVGADKVVFPERDMGERVARALVSDNIMEQITLSPEHSIIEMIAPPKFIGKTLQDIALGREFGVTVLAIRRGKEILISPNAKTEIIEGDLLVIIGRNEQLEKMEKLMNE
ncbi:TrkA family potassium uptake protein [Peptococcaceae bacterium]|nr:TrkA family potassium uptake protein [Peptococcaceae bacterium]MCL0106184.1 TrkA family potassium uptake protein [Peptococcaceae bacterium]